MVIDTMFYQNMNFLIGKFFDHPYLWSGLIIVSIFNSWQLAKYFFIRNKYDLLTFFAGLIVFIVILMSIAIIDNWKYEYVWYIER